MNVGQAMTEAMREQKRRDVWMNYHFPTTEGRNDFQRWVAHRRKIAPLIAAALRDRPVEDMADW